jgi:hypothetical protein
VQPTVLFFIWEAPGEFGPWWRTCRKDGETQPSLEQQESRTVSLYGDTAYDGAKTFHPRNEVGGWSSPRRGVTIALVTWRGWCCIELLLFFQCHSQQDYLLRAEDGRGRQAEWDQTCLLENWREQRTSKTVIVTGGWGYQHRITEKGLRWAALPEGPSEICGYELKWACLYMSGLLSSNI